MLNETLIAIALVGTTAILHATGFSLLLRALIRSNAQSKTGFVPVSRVMIGITCWLILLHLAEIAVWGIFYFWNGCLPDLESAFYFSGVTYTTVGYGDLVLPRPWRIVAMLEALTGILMCGLSGGLFFALVNQWITKFMERSGQSKSNAAALMRK